MVLNKKISLVIHEVDDLSTVLCTLSWIIPKEESSYSVILMYRDSRVHESGIIQSSGLLDRRRYSGNKISTRHQLSR